MRVHLLNMPFAALSLPAFALEQLRTVTRQALGERAEIRLDYPSHDFAEYLGMDLYHWLSTSLKVHATGLAEWFCAQVAFPAAPDRGQELLARYYPMRDPTAEETAAQLLERRASLEDFFDQLIARYGLLDAEVVGLTSMFSQNTACFALARRLKRARPDIVVVMGGANCEAPMGARIAALVGDLDYVFSGPALKGFPRFLELLEQGQGEAIAAIPGVFCRQNLGQRDSIGREALGEELPIQQPVPIDYGEFLGQIERRFPGNEVAPNLLFETSRGCWWGERSHCTFCGLNGQTMAFRVLPAELAIRQFEQLFRYFPRAKHFQGVDNILPRSYLKEVFPALEAPAGLTLYYEVKADLKDEELETLERAGVREIQPGIEALSTFTLRLMKKGTTAFQNLRFLSSCLERGLRPDWNLLVGFPGEPEAVYERYLEILPRLHHLPPPNGVAPVRFDRFSPYFTRAAEYGLVLEPCDYYPLIYPFAPEELVDLAYYFTDRNTAAGYRQALARWLGPLEAAVEQWKSRWRGGARRAPRLYLRPASEGRVVYDSRGEAAVEHELLAPELALLGALERPRRREDLGSEVNSFSQPTLEEAFERLVRDQLLFEEEGRFSSLVGRQRPKLAS